MNAVRSFVDTNVLVYAHRISVGPKHDKAQETRVGIMEVRVWDHQHTGIAGILLHR